MTEKEETIRREQQLVRAKDRELAQAQQLIETKDRELAQAQQLIETKDRELVRLRQEVSRLVLVSRTLPLVPIKICAHLREGSGHTAGSRLFVAVLIAL